MDECYDKIRFSLSDDSGELCFEYFEIIDAPECQEIAGKIRSYILGRPLRLIDANRIRSLECPGSGECMSTVAKVIEENQEIFGIPTHDND